MANINEIKNMIESAEAALKNAKKMLFDLTDGEIKASSSTVPTNSSPSPEDAHASKIIEGQFNGERMVAPDGETYPVPANYASKSKLVAGDHLKLSIMEDGRFVYKQIGPIPRKTLIGTLVHEDGQYKVIAEGRPYRVLLASVTYYKGKIGDNITIIVPETDDSEWAAIEAVLPSDVKDLDVTEDRPQEEEDVDF